MHLIGALIQHALTFPDALYLTLHLLPFHELFPTIFLTVIYNLP